MAPAIDIHGLSKVKGWTIHEVHEDLWKVSMHRFGKAVYHRASLENEHKYIWYQGQRIRKGNYKANPEDRRMGAVKWTPMIRDMLMIV